VKEKFRNFIQNECINVVPDENYFISYAFETKSIGKYSVIKLFNSGFEQFFFFDAHWKDYNFIASEAELEIKNDPDTNSPLITTLAENWDSHFISNHKSFEKVKFPLVAGASKFETESKEGIWTDFQTSNWYIPKLIYLCSCKKNYAVVNFILKGSEIVNLEQKFFERIGILDFNNGLYNKNGLDLSDPIEEDPEDLESWTIKINSALNEISQGHISKVVLSRRVEKDLHEMPSIQKIIDKLREDYKDCYIFAYKKNGSVFIGASPEKLLSFNHKDFETDALAGSIRRGSDDYEDRELELKLLQDPKNLREYDEVVKFVMNAVSPYCKKINHFEKPFIKKLPNIQHLWTPIKAELKTEKDIEEIVKRLHPTPAICGSPRETALKLISEIEEYPRGLFSGIIGWYNFEIQGEFAVAIRSALLKNKKIYAFAGCGIVEGSNPKEEFEETKLKLKPILSIFENEKIYQS
jgi:menaquinone-specific isochorismate synthase